jgi:hypothetical protein
MSIVSAITLYSNAELSDYTTLLEELKKNVPQNWYLVDFLALLGGMLIQGGERIHWSDKLIETVLSMSDWGRSPKHDVYFMLWKIAVDSYIADLPEYEEAEDDKFKKCMTLLAQHACRNDVRAVPEVIKNRFSDYWEDNNYDLIEMYTLEAWEKECVGEKH